MNLRKYIRDYNSWIYW